MQVKIIIKKIKKINDNINKGIKEILLIFIFGIPFKINLNNPKESWKELLFRI